MRTTAAVCFFAAAVPAFSETAADLPPGLIMVAAEPAANAFGPVVERYAHAVVTQEDGKTMLDIAFLGVPMEGLSPCAEQRDNCVENGFGMLRITLPDDQRPGSGQASLDLGGSATIDKPMRDAAYYFPLLHVLLADDLTISRDGDLWLFESVENAQVLHWRAMSRRDASRAVSFVYSFGLPARDVMPCALDQLAPLMAAPGAHNADLMANIEVTSAADLSRFPRNVGDAPDMKLEAMLGIVVSAMALEGQSFDDVQAFMQDRMVQVAVERFGDESVRGSFDLVTKAAEYETRKRALTLAGDPAAAARAMCSNIATLAPPQP